MSCKMHKTTRVLGCLNYTQIDILLAFGFPRVPRLLQFQLILDIPRQCPRIICGLEQYTRWDYNAGDSDTVA
jgi:hypothetical protein